jgi:hypothetical protein
LEKEENVPEKEKKKTYKENGYQQGLIYAISGQHEKYTYRNIAGRGEINNKKGIMCYQTKIWTPGKRTTMRDKKRGKKTKKERRKQQKLNFQLKTVRFLVGRI